MLKIDDMKPLVIAPGQNELVAIEGFSSSEKIKALVEIFRIVAKDKDLMNQKIFIPGDCENLGFSEGYHEIGTMLHFLADMMEE